MIKYRILPRLAFAVWILLVGASGFWFMGLESPTAIQGGFISTLWVAGIAAVMQTRSWCKRREGDCNDGK